MALGVTPRDRSRGRKLELGVSPQPSEDHLTPTDVAHHRRGVNSTQCKVLWYLAGRCSVSVRFTEAEIAEVWERREAGELTRSIARRLGRGGSSIRRVFEDAGGGCVHSDPSALDVSRA